MWTLGILPEIKLVIEIRLNDSLIGMVGLINFSTITVFVIAIIIIVDHLLTKVFMHDHR